MVSKCHTRTVLVLLIEEDPQMVDAMSLFLADEGYSVDTATDGEYGLRKAVTSNYDAILVSETLPERGGWFVLREVRRKRGRIPILMLTIGAPFENHREESGTDTVEYLKKPFTRSELISRVRALLQRESSIAETLIEFGSVSVDVESHTVIVEGRVVSLTAREHSLLEFLANRRGHLVRRTEIYNHLSDHFDASLANLVDVYISNIRRKLGSDVITTRRGHGYMIGNAQGDAVDAEQAQMKWAGCHLPRDCF